MGPQWNVQLLVETKRIFVRVLFVVAFFTPIHIHADDIISFEEQVHINNGNSLFSKKMYKEAVYEYARVLEINPDNSYVNKKIGLSYIFLGNDNLALTPLSKAMQSDPDDIEVIIELGKAYSREKDWAKSISLFETAVKKEPQNVGFRYMLSEAFLAEGKLDESIVQYKKILEIEPGNIGIRLKLGQAYAYNAKNEKNNDYFKDSLRELEWVLQREPNNIDALKEAGWIYLENKNISKAIDVLEKAYAIDNKDYNIQMHLALAYSWNRAYLKAIGLYNQVLIQKPQDIGALYALGEVYSWSRNYEKSLDSYEEILRIERDNTGALIGKARVYALQGKYNDADRLFQTVLQKEPDNLGALIGKAEMERWRWNWNTAILNYKRVLLKDKTNKAAQDGLDDIDFITSPSLESNTGIFEDSDKFKRVWGGGTLLLKPLDKTQTEFEYLRWIFQQGEGKDIYREDGSFKIKQHISSFLDIEAGYGLNRYTNEEDDKEFEHMEHVGTSSAIVNIRDAANIYLSYNYNVPLNDSILAIENYYSANVTGLGINFFYTDPLSIQGGYTISDYSDDNKKVTSEAQLTYRILDDPGVFLKGKYYVLSFDKVTNMYWSPPDYKISFCMLGIEKSFWKRSYVGIEGTGAFFNEESAWGLGVSGYLNIVIKDTVCINMNGSYFNADTQDPWDGNSAGIKCKIVF